MPRFRLGVLFTLAGKGKKGLAMNQTKDLKDLGFSQTHSMVGSIIRGTPIAGCFIVENP